MKKNTLLFVLVILSFYELFAQDSLLIYKKSGVILSIPTSEIDSIKFKKTNIIVRLNVQTRLTNGELPIDIYKSGVTLDSLYGKTYLGGILIYLDVVLGKGIIITNTPIKYTSGIYAGTAITTTLSLANTGCNNLTQNTYTDWVLPSIADFNNIYPNKVKLPGWSTSWTYWSKSQDPYNYGQWTQFYKKHFFDGSVISTVTSDNGPYGCVRYF